VCPAFKNVRQSVPSRWTGMSKSTASVGSHPAEPAVEHEPRRNVAKKKISPPKRGSAVS